MIAVTAPVSSLCYSSSLAPFVQLPLLRLFELLDLIQKRDLLESNLRNWNVIRAANKLISWNPSRKCLSFLFSLFLRHRFLSCILGIIYFSRENKKRKERREKREYYLLRFWFRFRLKRVTNMISAEFSRKIRIFVNGIEWKFFQKHIQFFSRSFSLPRLAGRLLVTSPYNVILGSR